MIADAMIGGVTFKELWGIALGSSDAAVVENQTDLQGAEVGRADFVDSYFVTPAGGGPAIVLRSDFTPSGTWNFEEAVLIHDDAAKGSRGVLSRALTGSVSSDIPFSFIWRVDF